MGSTIEVVHTSLSDEGESGLTRDVSYSSDEKGIGIICTDHRGDGTDAENALDIFVDQLYKISGSYTSAAELEEQQRQIGYAFKEADNVVVQRNGLVSAAMVKIVQNNVKATSGPREALIKLTGTNNVFVTYGEEIDYEAIGSTQITGEYDIRREIDNDSRFIGTDGRFVDMGQQRLEAFQKRNDPEKALGTRSIGVTSHRLLLPGDNLFLTSGTVFANLTNSDVLGALSFENPGNEMANRARKRSTESGHVRAMRGDITVINFKLIAP